MVSKLKPKSEFSRNVLTLMTGTTIAQAIPIAISPILTRIYTPEDFGILALFVAISSIFGSIANARYELAIMLPKKDEDAINIFALGFIITSVISSILLLLVVLFHNYFVILLNNQSIGMWLYLAPIAVFFSGVYNILNYFNNRKKYYKDMANATIIKSIITASIQLSIGFLKGGVSGLISGQLISQMFANMKLFKNILKDKLLMSKITRVKMIALAKRYKDFPKFSMWAGLANTLSIYLINILISTFYSVTTLGFYSLIQRLLGTPSSLVGGAIGQVFFQQATKEKQETGKAIISFNSTVKKLLIIGIPSFGMLFFTVKDIFVFVFGEEWRIAGVYAQILIVFFFISFITGAVSTINMVFEKQLNGLYLNLAILFFSLLTIFISYFYSLSFISYLYMHVSIFSILYLCILYYYLNVARGKY